MEHKLNVDFVFGNITDELKNEVVTFWTGAGAITDPEKARQRADQLVATCRDGDGNLIGVSTHIKYFYPPLQNNFHMSRTYIKDGHRNFGAMKAMFLEVWKNFNDKQLYLEEDIVGILAVMENPTLNEKKEAVWAEYNHSVLIGIDNRGFQIRGSYFPEAKIKLPAKT